MKSWRLPGLIGVILTLAFLYCKLQTTIEMVLTLSIPWASWKLLSQSGSR
jgi:hypothetical protein